MKNFILSALVLMVMLTITPTTFAQIDGANGNLDYNNNQNQSDPNFSQGQGGGQTIDDNNSLADWWWVLPLLAIPVALYLISRNDARDDSVSRDNR